MRALNRPNSPQILIDRGQAWLNDFLQSGQDRPSSSKYGHAEIRRELNSMSFHKCFYCETKLKDKPKEVDHQIEVSIDRNLAFTWDNLYLACTNCNDKANHDNIPINQALDPCRNSYQEIEEHLTYIDEQVTGKNNSLLGLKTIQKYRLDTELLDRLRMKKLQDFHKLLILFQTNLIKDKRKMSTSEIDALHFFKQDDQPFSLMFKVILAQYNL